MKVNLIRGKILNMIGATIGNLLVKCKYAWGLRIPKEASSIVVLITVSALVGHC